MCGVINERMLLKGISIWEMMEKRMVDHRCKWAGIYQVVSYGGNPQQSITI